MIIEELNINKIMENNDNLQDELQQLKEKYAIAKTTLEAVLWCVVPDDCRFMVEQVLKELNEKKSK